MRLPRRRFQKKPGASPGQAVFVGDIPVEDFGIDVALYGKKHYSRQKSNSIEEVSDAIEEGKKAWIYVSGIHQVEKVEAIAERLGLDRLILEDILNTGHRPKIAFFDDHIIIMMRILDPKEPETPHHLSLVLMQDKVVTFSNCSIDFFAPVFKRMENTESRIRKFPSDYLAWAIMDLVVDHYLMISEEQEAKLDDFDGRLLNQTPNIDSTELFAFKSQVNKLHRLIRPVREIVHHLRRSENKALSKESKPFYDDLYDHIIHAIEDAEHLREQASEIRDFYLSIVNNRMNEVMKLLTCFSAIFLPLTFLVGVYGMNFKFMPELEWKWAYPTIWVLFLTSTTLLLSYFKKRNWL